MPLTARLRNECRDRERDAQSKAAARHDRIGAGDQMAAIWKDARPLPDGSVLAETEWKTLLQDAERASILESAAGIAAGADVSAAEKIWQQQGQAGVLVLFSARNELEKAVGQLAESAQRELCPGSSLKELQDAAARLLQEIPAEPDAGSFAMSRNLYLRTEQQLQERKAQLAARSGEYRRAAASLKSLKTSDSWLNRENTRQISRVTALEREVRDYSDAAGKAEENSTRLQQEIEQAQTQLHSFEQKVQDLEDEMLVLRQDSAELEKSLTLAARLFQHEKWKAAEAGSAEKRSRLLTLQQDHVEQQMQAARCSEQLESLRSALAKSRAEEKRLAAARQESADGLVRARNSYANGEKMFADSQERIRGLEKRIRAMEAPLAASEMQCEEAQAHELPAAGALLASLPACSGAIRSALASGAAAVRMEDLPLEFLKALYLLKPAVIAAGSNAARFYAESAARPGIVLIFGEKPKDGSFPYTLLLKD